MLVIDVSFSLSISLGVSIIQKHYFSGHLEELCPNTNINFFIPSLISASSHEEDVVLWEAIRGIECGVGESKLSEVHPEGGDTVSLAGSERSGTNNQTNKNNETHKWEKQTNNQTNECKNERAEWGQGWRQNMIWERD